MRVQQGRHVLCKNRFNTEHLTVSELEFHCGRCHMKCDYRSLW
uniref:Uncharacterized protein n=1 Tax=Anguilla anguilla TaxID=7936 RepID=A0A0E9XMB9_ANGAN